MSNIKIPIPTPNDPESMSDLFLAFYEIVVLLRKHCPWDKEQTHESISNLLIEETYETIDAIRNSDDEEFSKELGDILLHVVMHSVMAKERDSFDMKSVLRKISNKLIHRHPHVFGDIKVDGQEEVLQNWENLKFSEGKKSTLDGVPNTLPALLRAERIQHKVANVGFDWDNREDIWDKVEEELHELRLELHKKNKELARNELGDLIFSIVNVARYEGIVAEEALQITNNKFIKRFQYIEQKAREMDRKLKEMTLAEMDAIWNEAKLIE